MTRFGLSPLESFGAHIDDLDLDELGAGDLDQLQAAYASHDLLVFSDQIVAEDSLASLLAAISGVGATGVRYDAIEEKHRNMWRVEASYSPQPPAGALIVADPSALGPVILRFTSTRLALRALNSRSKTLLEGLNATHWDAAHSDSRRHTATQRLGRPSDDVSHPIVIEPFGGGEPSLFVNPSSTAAIENFGRDDGLALLNQLFEHCSAVEFTQEIEMRQGMVVMWNNHALWHYVGHSRNHGHSEASPVRSIWSSGAPTRPFVERRTNTPNATERAASTIIGSVAIAAMTGIANAYDPERAPKDIEIVSEAGDDEPLPDFDFGDLPPLD